MKKKEIEAVRTDNYYSKIDLDILQRYFGGTSTMDEESQVDEWFRNPSYEKALHYKIKELWENFQEPLSGELNSESLLDKIHRKMHYKAWEKSQCLPIYLKFYRKYSKFAAAVLLPLLLLGGVYLYTGEQIKEESLSYAEIHSPPAARTRFELPDGSSGWLNSGSTLKFPTKFAGSNREVTLTGEGYFDVYHDPGNPFVITTKHSEVHALGTSFNVMSWPDEDRVTVTMESGLTAIYGLDTNDKRAKISELRAGEQLIYNSDNNTFNKSNVNTEFYTSWTEGKLIFRNEPMDVVLRKLGRWYNVDFIMDNREIEEYRYRATFKDESLDEVLKLLERTSPIEYKEIEREILSDSTYSRKQIRLFISP